jgi:hypothetical protein
MKILFFLNLDKLKIGLFIKLIYIVLLILKNL